MLKLTKRSEYGLIALRHLALAGHENIAAAKEMSECYGIPLPLLAKILQQLAREGFVSSEQGARGGYRLARAASGISALDVIRAIDGPVMLTSCSTHGEEECDLLDTCTVKAPLRRVQEGILKLLANISVADMAHLGDEDGIQTGPLYQLQPFQAAHERV